MRETRYWVGRLMGPSWTEERGRAAVRSCKEGVRDGQETRTGKREHTEATATEEPGNDHRRETHTEQSFQRVGG